MHFDFYSLFFFFVCSQLELCMLAPNSTATRNDCSNLHTSIITINTNNNYNRKLARWEVKGQVAAMTTTLLRAKSFRCPSTSLYSGLGKI